MKQNAKKGFAFLLAFVMVFALVGVQIPVTVQAATKITISCTKKTVAVGGKYTLTVQGVNDKKATYAWSSSDKKVATVSKKGVVTGVAEGSATIQCKITLSDKSTKTLSCKVTVKEQIAAKSVKISNAKLDENKVHTMVEGESYDFNRKLSPSKSNDKTYWYIQDEEYAKVDSGGVVTAKKAGTTLLIAKVGIDRVSAEEATNKVVASIRLNIVEPEATSADKFEYTIKEDGTVCITDYDESVTQVIVPRRIEGKLVTEIGESAFGFRRSLKSIKLPDSVTSIGEYAFAYCSNLRSVDMADSVTSIAKNAFNNCISLTSIKLSKGLTSIRFDDCISLTSIHLPEGLTSIDFINCVSLKSIDLPNSVKNVYVSNSPSLTSIDLPKGVTDIGFADCRNLTSIKIPEGVTDIGFAGCKKLTSINLPDSITSIGDNAFLGCSSLTSIDLPKNLTYMGENVFDGCSSLTSIEIPKSVKSMGYVDSIMEISSELMDIFEDCPSLKSIIVTAGSYAERWAWRVGHEDKLIYK